MRWIFVAVLALSFSAFSWGQPLPQEFSSSLRVDPAVLSPTPEDIAKRLLTLSTLLSSEAKQLTIELSESRNLLEESRNALRSCMLSLEEAQASLQARSAELWLWRGATALSVIGCACALVWGLSR